MKYFVFLLDVGGARIPDETARAYESLPIRRHLSFRWLAAGPGIVLICEDDVEDDVPIARCGKWTAVGGVRLDNRAEVKAWTRDDREPSSDLELALRLIARQGARSVARLVGDFAFVAWDGEAHSGIVARDAMGVKRLFFRRTGRHTAFSSRADALAHDGYYDLRFLAEAVAGCEHSPDRTPYADVSAFPAATIARVGDGSWTPSQYWSPFDFIASVAPVRDRSSLVEECRDLLVASVRSHMGRDPSVWAQLSGGMDSSSIVSTIEWLAERGDAGAGLAGTVTYVDHHGAGTDPREYSRPVADRFGLRNELVVDRGMWIDDGEQPPLTDSPTAIYPLYARERALCEIVRSSGGRVLLTGNGGDQLFAGNMFFFADWAVTGQFRAAVREMAHRAALGRVSFWDLARRNMVLPLLPAAARRRSLLKDAAVWQWITPVASRRYQLERRTIAAAAYLGRRGFKYRDAVAASIAAVPMVLYLGVLDDSLDVRHPYLYRPLVEFALGLPPELCVQPFRRKWILREAMSGIVPDQVRLRVGKGTLTQLYAWSLLQRRSVVRALLHEPLLEELGILNTGNLRRAVDLVHSAEARNANLCAAVSNTLGVEAWLRVRSGRWPSENRATRETAALRTALIGGHSRR